MSEQNHEKNRIPGFWQIVLVLPICLIVVAILSPVYAGGGPSYRAMCLSNIKQVISATSVYATDWDDTFPPYYSFDSSSRQDQFIDATFPYMKNKMLFRCSRLEQIAKEHKEGIGTEARIGVIDYVHCLALRGVIPDFSTGKRLLTLSKIGKPEQVGYLRDVIQGYGPGADGKTTGYLSSHGAKFNIGFIDGHARAVKIDDPAKEL